MGDVNTLPGARISDEAFARAWAACESTEQTARRLGMSRHAVYVRAKAMRARGIELPKQSVAP